jgi:hypothetical protein
MKCNFFKNGCIAGRAVCELPDNVPKNCSFWEPLIEKALKSNDELCPFSLTAGYLIPCDEIAGKNKLAEKGEKCHQGPTCLARNLPEVKAKYYKPDTQVQQRTL